MRHIAIDAVAWSVCLSVCLCVGHVRKPCKIGSTDRDAVGGVDSRGPKVPCIRWRSRYDEAPLQQVQNAATRLVARLGPYDHVSATLKDLHWLPIEQRIVFRLCVLMHQVHIGLAPSYLRECVTASANVTSRPRLRSSSSQRYERPRMRCCVWSLVNIRSRVLDPEPGTVCRPRCKNSLTPKLSDAN